MMNTILYHCGDTSPVRFRFTRKDPVQVELDVAIDLSDCDVTFSLFSEYTKEYVFRDHACVIDDPGEDGWVSYYFATEENDVAGMYMGKFRLIDGDGKISTWNAPILLSE